MSSEPRMSQISKPRFMNELGKFNCETDYDRNAENICRFKLYKNRAQDKKDHHRIKQVANKVGQRKFARQ